MIRLFPLLICVFLLHSAPVNAAEFETDSTLQSATVYTNRATLTRQAVVDVPAGAHTVIFKNLPANLLPDSLRAEGKAVATVTFGALSHKRVIEAELTAPREKELTDQLEAMRDLRKVVEAEKTALAIKKEFLKNISEKAELRTGEEIAELNLAPEEWTAAADTIHENSLEILKATLGHDVKLRELDKQIQKIQTELNQSRTGQRHTYQVSIPLDVKQATKLTVNLSYQVPNASWRPLYDARLDTEDGDLELIQYGAVRQTTGEDWSDIALTLSTAQPHRGASLPPMKPMWVNIYKHGGRSGYAKRGAFMDRGVANMSVAMAPASADYAESDVMEEMAFEQEARFVGAEINTGGFVSEYVIRGPSSVPSDGTESKLMIGTFDTENKMQIHVKPQMSTNAILASRTKLQGESPILPGQVSLFRDGAYVGQSDLPLLRPGEESKLTFGIDDQVSVERHVMKDETGEAGVIGKSSTQEKNFETIVHNLHSTPVEIVVFETVPVAKNEDIDIEILKKSTTEGYETDAFNIKGLYQWTQTFQPKEEKKIKLGWRVSWPADHTINGL